MTYYDCPNCTNECCNTKFEELVHAEISLKYVANCLDRGYSNKDLIDRLLSDVKRLSDALKECR